MNNELFLIMRGFVIASLGGASSMLLIIAVSAAYVGRYEAGVWSLVAAVTAAYLFRKFLSPYIDELETRATDELGVEESRAPGQF